MRFYQAQIDILNGVLRRVQKVANTKPANAYIHTANSMLLSDWTRKVSADCVDRINKASSVMRAAGCGCGMCVRACEN